jgi:hypothetical protein
MLRWLQDFQGTARQLIKQAWPSVPPLRMPDMGIFAYRFTVGRYDYHATTGRR